MNIFIIEDEKRNYNQLKRMLEEIDYTFRITGPATSITETVEYLQRSEMPDLILADICLTDGLSFEAFSRVDVQSPVIFTTAYDEFAIKAFKYNGIDYLLKPIDPEELSAAIEKAKSQRRLVTDNNLQILLEHLQRNNCKYRERFLLPYRDGYKTVLVQDVNHIYSENKVTRLFMNDGTSEALPQTMDTLEGQLSPDDFFRANRQYIVHINSVEHIGNYFNSKLIVRLKHYPKVEVVISREKAAMFKEWLDR